MKTTNDDSQEEVMNTIETTDEIENIAVQSTSKVGTWISVGIVGAVILSTYIVLYGLYMIRV